MKRWMTWRKTMRPKRGWNDADFDNTPARPPALFERDQHPGPRASRALRGDRLTRRRAPSHRAKPIAGALLLGPRPACIGFSVIARKRNVGEDYDLLFRHKLDRHPRKLRDKIFVYS